MGKRKFLTRMERRRKEQASQNEVKAPIKKVAKGVAVLIITASLVSCSFNLPHVKAYFTDRITYKDAHPTERNTMSSLGSGAIRLFFNIHRFENLKMRLDLRFEENVLVAAVNLPKDSGFDADDIMAKSIKFTYSDRGNKAITPTKVETRGSGLVLWFDWDEVESFINGSDNDPGFDISGKGKGPGESGLGERFIFEGYGEITGLSDYTVVPEPEEEPEDETEIEANEGPEAIDPNDVGGEDGGDSVDTGEGDGDSTGDGSDTDSGDASSGEGDNTNSNDSGAGDSTGNSGDNTDDGTDAGSNDSDNGNEGASDTGGSDTGGSDTGGSDTGGSDTGGSDTGGSDTGGDNDTDSGSGSTDSGDGDTGGGDNSNTGGEATGDNGGTDSPAGKTEGVVTNTEKDEETDGSSDNDGDANGDEGDNS